VGRATAAVQFGVIGLGDRRIDFGEAMEDPVAQPPEQPALDHEDRLLDLGLIESRRLHAVWVRSPARCVSRTPFIRGMVFHST
jgi:hypothetical protein